MSCIVWTYFHSLAFVRKNYNRINYMKYIIMSNNDPLLIVNSEKDAIEYVESVVAGFVANDEQHIPRIHYVKCKSESDFAMFPSMPSLGKGLWVGSLLALYVINLVAFLMEDSMKSGICMLMCLMTLFETTRRNDKK